MNATISKVLGSKVFGMVMGMVACKLVEIACSNIGKRFETPDTDDVNNDLEEGIEEEKEDDVAEETDESPIDNG